MESLACITGPAVVMPLTARPRVGLKYCSESGERCAELVLDFERSAALPVATVDREPKAWGLAGPAPDADESDGLMAAGAVTGR